MAEFIFKDMLSEAGITGFTVASSATSSETVWNGKGSAVYPPAEAELLKKKLKKLIWKSFRSMQVSSYPYLAKTLMKSLRSWKQKEYSSWP